MVFVDSLAGAIPCADVTCFVVSTVANNKVEIWAGGGGGEVYTYLREKRS